MTIAFLLQCNGSNGQKMPYGGLDFGYAGLWRRTWACLGSGELHHCTPMHPCMLQHCMLQECRADAHPAHNHTQV